MISNNKIKNNQVKKYNNGIDRNLTLLPHKLVGTYNFLSTLIIHFKTLIGVLTKTPKFSLYFLFKVWIFYLINN